LSGKYYLVTGAAGFIGYHLCNRLLCLGIKTIGFDNLNEYYDVNLKKERLNILKRISNKNNTAFIFIKGDLENFSLLETIYKKYEIEIVFNLAAQAGVRYSITNPNAYIQSNLVGFGNILELSKIFKPKHLIFASSSSVYGGNTKKPFYEIDQASHPISLYGATKRANELMAHSYSHLFNIKITGLRFFTVYGPWGRPDMALFIFTKNIIENKPINLFNNGDMIRDFTFIDDITESLIKISNKTAELDSDFDTNNPDPSNSWAPFKIFNIGSSNPISLTEYIDAIEEALGKKAIRNYMPLQKGDVKETASDCKKLEEWIGFKPKTKVKDGIYEFVSWYLNFYKK
tara:strand:- start:1846 stop:2877 length:1032 start_codon:yes stop_codon:yes gene_type:complete